MIALLLALVLSGSPFEVHVVTADNLTVTLAWDPPLPNEDLQPTDYEIDWGTAPGFYPNQVPVPGKVVQASVTMPGPGTYYFVVRAINPAALPPVSANSNEVSTSVQDTPPDPKCAPPLGSEAVSAFVTKLFPSTNNVGTRVAIYFLLASKSAVTDIHALLDGQPVSSREPVTGVDAGAIWFTAPLVPGTYSPAVFVANKYGCNFIQTKGADGKKLSFTVK